MHPPNSKVTWTIAERQLVIALYTKTISILKCGCWDSAKRLRDILKTKLGSIMDIVHCYDAINDYGDWYPRFQKMCLDRESRLPELKKLRLPYIEKAKDISLNELVQMIFKGLQTRQMIHIFQHYYGMNSGPLRDMNRVDLATRLAEQLVLDSVGRGGTDDKEEEEVPAPFTVFQIQRVIQPNSKK